MHKAPAGKGAMNTANGTAAASSDHRQRHFTLTADLAELGPLAESVDSLAADLGWDDAIAMQINLVLEELIANAINYGYPDGRTGHIAVWLDADPREIRLRIEDDGDAFDPFAVVAPPDLSQDIEARPIGGLGLHFVRTYMDSCAYRYADGRNRVTLTKRLH
jgi:serine/threonine-protein kinase RsbW